MEKIGSVELSDGMQKYIPFFMQDKFNLDSCVISDENSVEHKATPKDCIGLERASVWEAKHIEKRILDEMFGIENKTASKLKVKNPS